MLLLSLLFILGMVRLSFFIADEVTVIKKRPLIIYALSAIIIFLCVAILTGRFFSTSVNNKMELGKYKSQCKLTSYEKLSMKNEQYVNSKVMLSGKVVDIHENKSNITLDVNVTKIDGDKYKDKVCINYIYGFGENRIQKNDIINVWGEIKIRRAYEFNLRHQIIFPEIDAKTIEIVEKGEQ